MGARHHSRRVVALKMGSMPDGGRPVDSPRFGEMKTALHRHDARRTGISCCLAEFARGLE